MKKTRKLIVPIALLVLAVMAVTSTTFAWFTVNSQVSGYMQGAGVISREDMLFIVSIENSVDNGGDPTDTGTWVSRAEDNVALASYTTGFGGLKLMDLTYLRAGDKNLKAGDDTTEVIPAGAAKDGLYLKDGSDPQRNKNYLEFVYNFWHTGAGNRLQLELNPSLLSLTSSDESIRRFEASEYNYFGSFFNRIKVSDANYKAFEASFSVPEQESLLADGTRTQDIDGITVYQSGDIFSVPFEADGTTPHVRYTDSTNWDTIRLLDSSYVTPVAPTGPALDDYIAAGYEAYRVGNSATATTYSGTNYTPGTVYYFNIGKIITTGDSLVYKAFQSAFDTPTTYANDGEDLALQYGINTLPAGYADDAAYIADGYEIYNTASDSKIWYFNTALTVYDDLTSGTVKAGDVLDFYGDTAVPVSGLNAYNAAGYNTFIDENDTEWYFNMDGSYTALAQQAARVMFTAYNPIDGTTSRTLWNPYANAGYDATTGGVRDYNFDVQDLYTLVQTSRYGELPMQSYDPYDGNGIAMTGIDILPDYVAGTGTTYTLTRFHNNATGVTPSTVEGPSGPRSVNNIVVRNGIDYYRASVSVMIWLEGWDSDCFNAILGAQIQTNMNFSTPS